MHKPPVTREESIAYREALASLIHHGGYKLLSAFMSGLSSQLLEQLMQTANPDERAVLAGGIRVLNQIKNWPEIQLKAFAQHLDKPTDKL